MICRKALIPFLVLAVTSTSACFSRSQPPPAVTTPSATLVSVTPPTPPVAATAGENSASPQPVAAEMTVGTVEEAAAIERYRVRILIDSEGTAQESDVQIEGAYIKAPPAEELTMQFQEGAQTRSMTMLLVDGVRYMKSGEVFMQTPDMALNIHELTLITPANATHINSAFTNLGEETVNSRPTIHYQGGPEVVPTGGTASDQFDVTAIDTARIDLWVDKAENFIVKMEITLNGMDDNPNARYLLRFEYYDFNNADIVITPPADALSLAEQAASSAASSSGSDGAPRTALGKLLGFDLLLPTGSEITLASDQLVQASTPYTLEEATKLFQSQMPANGYTLLSEITPQAGEAVLMYQKAQTTATIHIKAAANGSQWDVVVAP